MKKLLTTLLLTLSVSALAADMPGQPVGEWSFDVYIDDKRVGTHDFAVTDTGENRFVRSEADFKVKFLIFTAYTYFHTNQERWANDCLIEFNSNTSYNDEEIAVSGEQTEDGFMVEKKVEKTKDAFELPECVMTFAYWNRSFLEQDKLLNPQNGEYLDVSVERIGEEQLEIRGESVNATQYQLKARNIDIKLWYSGDDQWLALESIAKTGHVIRYELS